MRQVFLLAFATALLLKTRAVNAHGYVDLVTTPSQQYTGWLPFTDPYARHFS